MEMTTLDWPFSRLFCIICRKNISGHLFLHQLNGDFGIDYRDRHMRWYCILTQLNSILGQSILDSPVGHLPLVTGLNGDNPSLRVLSNRLAAQFVF